MLSSRRTRVEIIADILKLCQTPQCKTRVMYKTDLSWQATGNYISFLKSTDLLKVQNSPIKYLTTDKGALFLECWTEMALLLVPTPTKSLSPEPTQISARFQKPNGFVFSHS